jgi:phospholipid-binding lipoprotein MlaA
MPVRPIFLPTIAAMASAGAAVAGEPPALERPPNFAPPQALSQSDPLEAVNRQMFKLDRGISKLLGGVGGSPLNAVPPKIRRGVYNVFSNLDEPVSAANQVLQGKFRQAAVSTGRFVTNTTVGLLGTRDVATGMGMVKHHEDFGQTLAKYGVPAGPYIYLPLLGPSTMRDKLANQVDGMARPLGMVDAGTMGGQAISGVRTAAQPASVSIRQRARAAKDDGYTEDEYATLRDLYYAKRAAEIEDAAGADETPRPRWKDQAPEVRRAREPEPVRRHARVSAPDRRYARPQARYAEAEGRGYAYGYDGQGYGRDYAPPPRDRRERRAAESARMAAAQAAHDAYGDSAGDGWPLY